MTPYYWSLVGFFLVGYCLHLLAAADGAFRNKTNAIATRWQYIVTYWPQLLIRGAINTALCIGWILYPSLLSDGLSKIGVTTNFTIPLNPIVAFGLGYVIDSLLDKILTRIPGASTEVPPAPQVAALLVQNPIQKGA